jgi:hypothetical protein
LSVFCEIALAVSASFLLIAIHGAEGGELPTGVWGGKHISLEVTKTGGVLEYDCAHGSIDQKIVPDRQGNFRVSGKHVEEHGGPVRQSEKSEGYAVVYVGQIKGEKMKLSILRKDNKKTVGTFALTRGQEPFVVKCR